MLRPSQALAYGTESIPQVDKIVGPGGVFVTLAKSLLSEIVSIDMIAGPTELAIVADATANAELIALDMISQAEHSPDTMCCLITNSLKLKNFRYYNHYNKKLEQSREHLS